MTTDAKLAQGWAIEFDSVPVPEVTNFDLGYTVTEVDVTSHDSADSTREFIPGLKEPQEITLTVNWNITDHGALFDIIGDATAVAVLTFAEPDASETYSVSAWVKGCTIHGPAGGEVETADIVFRTTGALTRSGS